MCTGVHMSERANIYIASFFGAVAVASLLLAVILLPRRRHSRAADSLIVLTIGISFWCSAYAMSFANLSIAAAELWLDLTYVSILTAPTAMLFFVARYTRFDAWITEFRRHALLVMPLVFAAAIYVPPFRTYFIGNGRNPQTAVLDQPGPVYWVYLLYVSLLLAGSTLLVARFMRRCEPKQTRSARLLVVAMVLPWGASVVSSANLYIADIDPTVLSLAVTTGIFVYLVLSERILDVGSLARREMLNVMLDGFIALDATDRVVEISPRALEILELSADDVMLKPLGSALADRPQVLGIVQNQGGGLLRLTEGVRRERLILVDVLPLSDRSGARVGRTFVLRDQTALYVDELTRIGNRRYFFDQVPALVAVCQRSGVAVSLAIIDLDGLKAINAGLGHLGGDAALVRVADALRSRVRTVDVIARMGGDEFVALLPGASEAEAAVIIERVRNALSAADVAERVTVSAGIAEIPSTDSVLHAIAAADRALYLAKERGRDRLVCFSDAER